MTQNWNPGGAGGTYNDAPVGVRYDLQTGRWGILNEDQSTMPLGADFNVLVLPKSAP